MVESLKSVLCRDVQVSYLISLTQSADKLYLRLTLDKIDISLPLMGTTIYKTVDNKLLKSYCKN